MVDSSTSPELLGASDLPKVFGRYLLTSILGQGGVGRVFAAELQGPEGFRKQVALKVLRAHAGERADERNEGFLREARIGGLLHHPNVVDTYDFGIHEGRPFLAMERIDGQPLNEIIAEFGALPATVVLDIGVQLCDGLTHAHGLRVEGRPGGLVHRDLKPHNILVTQQGLVKILDFGLARAAEGPQDANESGENPEGTPAYMSPEQARSEAVDTRTDLFALGLILYEIAVGERFILSHNPLGALLKVTRIEEEMGRLASLERAVPGLHSVVGRCLRVQPSERFSRATEIGEALENLRRSLPPGPDLRAFVGRLGSSARSDVARQVQEVIPDFDAPTIRVADEPTIDPEEHSFTDTRSSALAARQTNLPPEIDSFVGREEETLALARSVGPGRLVTLVGPGGSGKTRLAVRFATDELELWVGFGGVWFIDLSKARGREEVISALASVLGIKLDDVQGEDEEAALRVGWALAARGRALLILDNLEQVAADAASLVSGWMGQAPEACFLSTSRVALKIEGEISVYLDALSARAAADLFEARARSARSDFTLNEAEVPIVDEIVRRLDGNPLAVELAAARVGMLTPSNILARLNERFKLLRSTRKLGRGSTLEGTIAWSWDLLAPFEQEALWQCTVFRGSFDIEAAELVLDLDHYPDQPWVLDVLEALRDQSMLRAEPSPEAGGSIRFRILESIRTFSEARGETFEGWSELAERHARTLLEACEELATSYASSGDVRKRRRLEEEADNLKAVFERAELLGAELPVRAGLVLSNALRWNRTRQSFVELVSLIEETVTDDLPLELRVRVLWEAADASRHTGRSPRAIELLESAAAMAEDAGMSRLACRSWCMLAEYLGYLGRPAETAAMVERAEELAAALQDDEIEAFALRARALYNGHVQDRKSSIRGHRQALQAWERLENRIETADELHYLSVELALDGQASEAMSMMVAAKARFSELGNQLGACLTAGNHALVMGRSGDYEAADRRLAAVVVRAARGGLRQIEALTLTSRAHISVLLGRPERALKIAAAAHQAAAPLQIDPVLVRCSICQAAALWAGDRLPEAISALEQVLEQPQEGGLEPQRPLALAFYSAAQSAARRADEARSSFSQLQELVAAVQESPDRVLLGPVEAALRLATTEAGEGEGSLEELRDEMGRLVESTDDLPVGLRSMAFLLRRDATRRIQAHDLP